MNNVEIQELFRYTYKKLVVRKDQYTLTAQTYSAIFIDTLCAYIHIFRQTTHQKLMSQKHGCEYDRNRM